MSIPRTIDDLSAVLGKTTETYLDVSPKDFLNKSKEFPCHLGQKKQFYALFDFLTRCSKVYRMKQCLLTYVGAAPGGNISLVLAFFPELKADIYDPLPINVKTSEQVQVFTGKKGVFNDKSASSLKQRCDDLGRQNLLLFCDIRTGKDEVEVARDMNVQQRWVRSCTPDAICLRLQPRYDVYRFRYIQGDVCLQVNAPPRSTQCRLIAFADSSGSDNSYTDRVYDVDELDRLLHAFNIRVRTMKQNSPTAKAIEAANIGVRGDFEAELEMEMIKSYISIVQNKKPSLREMSVLFSEINKRLSSLTSVPLRRCSQITKQRFIEKHRINSVLKKGRSHRRRSESK